MKFIRTEGWDEAIADFTDRLLAELSAGKKVLWLTSGGSNIKASVEIMSKVPEPLTANLSVMPSDERFGPPGHADSNWQKLLAAGFDGKQAKLLPVLKIGQNFESAQADYASMAEAAFAANEFVICQLGIGSDGHTLGILLNSPAVEAKGWIAAFEGPDFQRLTLTFEAFAKVNAVYAFMFGEDKLTALTNLKDKNLPLAEQPAQFLKQMSEVYIYNDQVEG
jgi:6-phosphogluconolactonase/glucosamine-6-phosphate isomerase/deaminase